VGILTSPSSDIDKSGGRIDRAGKQESRCRHVSSAAPSGRLKVINVYTLSISVYENQLPVHNNALKPSRHSNKVGIIDGRYPFPGALHNFFKFFLKLVVPAILSKN
jgi:hypothetical protein